MPPDKSTRRVLVGDKDAASQTRDYMGEHLRALPMLLSLISFNERFFASRSGALPWQKYHGN